MKHRFICVGVIRDEQGRVLITKMPDNLGAYPGQWGILGGGVEEGEMIEDALKREAQEELGISIDEISPFTFHDDIAEKIFPDGHKEEIYMVYLIFDCRYKSGDVVLNEEWERYEWVKPEMLSEFDLNGPTIKTFSIKGWV